MVFAKFMDKLTGVATPHSMIWDQTLQLESEEVRGFMDELYDRYQLDLSGCDADLTRLQLQSYMIAHHQESLESCLCQLKKDKEERCCFMREVPLRRRYLFDDVMSYRFIRQHIMEELKQVGDPLIMVASCGLGEDAYSLAIIAQYLEVKGLSVIGIDHHDTAVEMARTAVIPSDIWQASAKLAKQVIAEDEDFTLLSFGKKQEQGVLLINDIRQHVTICQHDLERDKLLGRAHFVVFRDPYLFGGLESYKQMVRKLGQMLPKGGYMMLDNDETVMRMMVTFGYEKVAEDIPIFKKIHNGR